MHDGKKSWKRFKMVKWNYFFYRHHPHYHRHRHHRYTSQDSCTVEKPRVDGPGMPECNCMSYTVIPNWVSGVIPTFSLRDKTILNFKWHRTIGKNSILQVRIWINEIFTLHRLLWSAMLVRIRIIYLPLITTKQQRSKTINITSHCYNYSFWTVPGPRAPCLNIGMNIIIIHISFLSSFFSFSVFIFSFFSIFFYGPRPPEMTPLNWVHKTGPPNGFLVLFSLSLALEPRKPQSAPVRFAKLVASHKILE